MTFTGSSMAQGRVARSEKHVHRNLTQLLAKILVRPLSKRGPVVERACGRADDDEDFEWMRTHVARTGDDDGLVLCDVLAVKRERIWRGDALDFHDGDTVDCRREGEPTQTQ